MAEAARAARPQHRGSAPTKRVYPAENNWTPSMLRDSSLLALITANFLVLAAVTILHLVSSRNAGLGTDDGSKGVLFAWRFLPTAVAVVFNIFISILLDNVKRTEGLARLAPPDGAPALVSMLYVPGSWWQSFAQSFPHARKNRRFSPTLFCSSLSFILGFAVLSPASSVLLASRNVVLERSAPFNNLVPPSDVLSQVQQTDEIYFRSIGNLVQNATTSPWLTDRYAVVPFWLQDSGARPSQFSPTTESWRATTTVFSSEIKCEPMNTEDIRIFYYHEEYENIEDSVYYWPTVEFSSPSGCNVTIVDQSGPFVSWANTSATYDLRDIVSNDPTSQKNKRQTSGCGRNETIVYTNTLADYGDEFSMILRTNASAKAWNCETSYYVGETLVTALMNNSGSFVQVDEDRYKSVRTEMPAEASNGPTFDERFLNADWASYLYATSGAVTDSEDAFDLDMTEGPATLLGALTSYSLRTLDDAPVDQYANHVKQRFFGESLYNFLAANTTSINTATGTASVVQRRVLVVSAIAIVLEVSLGCQFFLLLMVFFSTRAGRRRLNYPDDPAIAMTVARAITNQKNTLLSLKPALESSPKQRKQLLRKHQYGLSDGQLKYLGPADTIPAKARPWWRSKQKSSKGPHPYPSVLRLKQVYGIATLLILTIAASIALFVVSRTISLYQPGFIYQAQINVSDFDLQAFNPAAFVTTLVAVSVSLWWGSIDAKLRAMQPYLMLADQARDGTVGAFLSYQSVYLVWAAFKAWTYGHKVLMLICLGSTLMQVLTVAMSALWTIEERDITRRVSLPRALEIRKIPHISEGQWGGSRELRTQAAVMEDLFQDMQVSWMYSAAIQATLNGSRPAWTADDWNFVPFDITDLPNVEGLQNVDANPTSNDDFFSRAPSATFETQAIRARLDCSSYDLADTEQWLTSFDLGNSSTWNTSSSPSYLTNGWELGANLAIYHETSVMYTHSDDPAAVECPWQQSTPFYPSEGRLVCCENITDDSIGSSSAGYWSRNSNQSMLPFEDQDRCPQDGGDWEIYDFSVKWIRGRPVENYVRVDRETPHMIWADPPRISASNCRSIIETADVRVKAEVLTGRVLDYELLGPPQQDKWAWIDHFVPNRANEKDFSEPDGGLFNVTTSHGVLFVTALSVSAQLAYMEPIPVNSPPADMMESFSDRTFKVRGPGLNVDYMTYSMLKMVNDDHEALLDPKTLQDTASKTFSTFFQHFANHNLSASRGGWVYQRLGERLPLDVGNSTPTAFDDAVSSYPAGAQIEIELSIPVEVLEMSQTAAIICLVILVCLVAIAIILAVSSRRQQHLILRRIESFADVALLFAASNRLLQLLRDPKITNDAIKHGKDTQLRLGWFTATDGSRRWGIELVGAMAPTPATAQEEEPLGSVDHLPNKPPGEYIALLPTPVPSEQPTSSPLPSPTIPHTQQATRSIRRKPEPSRISIASRQSAAASELSPLRSPAKPPVATATSPSPSPSPSHIRNDSQHSAESTALLSHDQDQDGTDQQYRSTY